MYITLVSNVSIDTHDNKIAKFRTKLSRTVTLDGVWCVGLSEITYTKSWYNVLNSVPIVLYDEMGNDYIPNEEIKNDFTLLAGYYETSQKLIGELNKIFDKFNYMTPPKLEYNEINNKVTLHAGKAKELNVYPYLGDEIEDLLGLKNRNFNKNIYSTDVNTDVDHVFKEKESYTSTSITGYHPVEITAGYQSLYLYSDIVYPSLIGDTCAPILRLIEVPRKYKFGDTVHLKYDKPHYRQLLCNNFETIELALYDDSGNLVPFKFGKIAVTLHFKKL